MTTINNNSFLNDLSLIPNYIMEEILDINGNSKAELLSEDSDEYKNIEEVVNLQIKKEEHKKLKKQKFSILQKSLKKLMIQKLEINSKTIYLVEGTIIFYYDKIFNHLIKENKKINTIGHSDRLAFTYNLNDKEVLIIHKSALKILLKMNVSDQSRVFNNIDENSMKLSENFIESSKIEQYIIIYGLDIKCLENIFKFIINNPKLISLYNNFSLYYYLLMISPYYISALDYYDKDCCNDDEKSINNIFDLIISIILRKELRNYIEIKTSSLDYLYKKIEKVLEKIILEDFDLLLINHPAFVEKYGVRKILCLNNELSFYRRDLMGCF